MKKIFTFLFTVLTFSAFSQTLLPNFGFETWTTQTAYETPNQWGSSNYAEFPGVNVFKSNDAQHMSHSALLQTIVFGTDTAFAYVYQGEIGQSGPEAGIPYSAPVNQLKGYYKYNVASGDTAMAMVIKFMGGTMVSMDLVPITGTQSTWTAFTFSVNAVPQDSIFFGFISTNPFAFPMHADPATWLMVDNISLEHSVSGPGPAISNNSFETWTPVSYTDADGWDSFNELLMPYGYTAVSATSDAYAGTQAAQIETIELTQFGDTLDGYMFFGLLDQTANLHYLPYTGTPTNLTGYYKYTPSGSDVAQVIVEFSQNGSIIGGNTMQLNPSATYTSFNLTTNLSGTPDSAIVMFTSGTLPGSVLKIDNVQFSGGNVSVQEIENFSYSIYPNPVSDLLFINLHAPANVSAEVTDMQGKKVLSVNFLKGEMPELDVHSLPAGVYLLSLTESNQRVSRYFSVIR